MGPLSYSSISTYLECPLKFRLIYIDDLMEIPKPYFSFGSSLHSALEFMYSFRPPPPKLEDVLASLQKKWVSKGYESEEEEEGYFSYGRKIITDYYYAHAKEMKPPLAVELKFDINVEGVAVTGFIDRIDRIPGNKAEIIDYKSGKRLFDRAQVEESKQLTLYQLAAENSLGIKVGRLSIYHLPSQTMVSVGARDEKRIEGIKSTVLRVSKLIKKGEFQPKIGRFCPCDFPNYCPYFMHLYEDGKERKNKSLKLQKTIEGYSEHQKKSDPT